MTIFGMQIRFISDCRNMGLGDVDKIGAVAAGLTAAGVAAHGAMSVVQKKKRDAQKTDGKQVDE